MRYLACGFGTSCELWVASVNRQLSGPVTVQKGRSVGLSAEQEEAQEESQIGVLRDLANFDGTAAVLRVIGSHVAKVLFGRGKVGGDQRRGGVRRPMEAVIRDAGRMERN